MKLVAPALIVLALGASACARFVKPDPYDEGALRERAITTTKDGVRASAALLLPEEIEPIFRIDVSRKGMQPVWLEIENDTERPLFFLITGVDPEYFAPFELGHAFHATFGGQANQRLDEHVLELAFDHRPQIDPGETVSGFVYTNQSQRTKVVDIDLLGAEWSTSLTLFVPDPADAEAAARMSRINERYTEAELVHTESDAELRRAIERLPCCARDGSGCHVAPLNLVFIGELGLWGSAGQMRGYRYQAVHEMFAFQRPQDAAGRKGAQWIDAQSHILRFWQTPLRYRSRTVWLAQACTPRGGRFAAGSESIAPDVDDARNDLLEDLFYSQSLAKVGFSRGAGCPAGTEAGVETDGLRVLMIFEEHAISLAEIDFFDWERLVDYR